MITWFGYAFDLAASSVAWQQKLVPRFLTAIFDGVIGTMIGSRRRERISRFFVQGKVLLYGRSVFFRDSSFFLV